MKSSFRAQLRKAVQRYLDGPNLALTDRYPEYEIGPGSYGGLTVLEWGEGAILRIGAYTSIGTGVKVLLGGEHRTDWVTTFPFSALWKAGKGIEGHPRSKGNVIIGSDVWIANEAMIMSGVTVGDGAVIAARAVVAKNVPAYAVVAGNPSTIVKFRFDAPIIARLLEIKWWEWEPSRIENSLPALLSDNIEAFLAAAESGKL